MNEILGNFVTKQNDMFTAFKTYLVLSGFLLYMHSCGMDRYPQWFRIQNNSGKNIYFTYSNKYPDTAVDNSVYLPPGSTRTPSVVINAGQSYMVASSITLDKYFAATPSDTLQLFIYDADVVKNTPWTTVVSKYLVLKRYSLTLDSIKKLNGTI